MSWYGQITESEAAELRHLIAHAIWTERLATRAAERYHSGSGDYDATDEANGTYDFRRVRLTRCDADDAKELVFKYVDELMLPMVQKGVPCH